MELWNKCSEKLENKLSQEDFNTWIRPLKASVEKNTLSLTAPNDFILDYIVGRGFGMFVGAVLD